MLRQHGRLTIEVSRPINRGQVNELIPADLPGDQPRPPDEPRGFYCPYPPMPALLLLPFVALSAAVKVETACRVVSVLSVLLFDACLVRLSRRLGMPAWNAAPRIALNLLFAFGTVSWHNAERGGDWHLAHAVALAAMLLALREYLRGDFPAAGSSPTVGGTALSGPRPWIMGAFLAAALLSRPTTAFAGLFFALPLLRRRNLPELVKLAAVPALALFVLAAYNHVRFSSPTDFGYDRMILHGQGLAMMRQYGQFHPHFIPGNAFWFFLAPPWPLADGRFPFFGFDQRGLSLFLATPAFAYAFVAFTRRRRRCLVVQDALIGIFACLVPLLLYFNTGYAQFGHRFSLDYLPLLMLLVAAGMGPRPGKLAYALIAASIAIQAVGVLCNPVTRLPFI